MKKRYKGYFKKQSGTLNNQSSKHIQLMLGFPNKFRRNTWHLLVDKYWMY